MRKAVALIVVSMLLMAACSSNEMADQGNRSRAGKKKDRPAASSGEGKGKSRASEDEGAPDSAPEAKDEAEDIQDQAAAGSGGATNGQSAPQDFGGSDAPTSGVDPSLARASASVDDPASDSKRQGVTPPYTEMTRASIEGLGKNVRFTITFAGPVPERVDKDQYMVTAFGVTGRKEGEGYGVGGICDENGWRPYAGSKGQNEKFPGTFEVSGNQIVMEVAWKYVNGPRAFEWYVSSGWYGKVANQTHWAFDGAPNGEAGRFPG